MLGAAADGRLQRIEPRLVAAGHDHRGSWLTHQPLAQGGANAASCAEHHVHCRWASHGIVRSGVQPARLWGRCCLVATADAGAGIDLHAPRIFSSPGGCVPASVANALQATCAGTLKLQFPAALKARPSEERKSSMSGARAGSEEGSPMAGYKFECKGFLARPLPGAGESVGVLCGWLPACGHPAPHPGGRRTRRRVGVRHRVEHVLVHWQHLVVGEDEPQVLEALGQPPAPLHIRMLRVRPCGCIRQPSVAGNWADIPQY